MELDKAKYVIRYFPRLMTGNETAAVRHAMYCNKLNQTPAEKKERFRKMFLSRGLISESPEVLAMLDDGYETLITRIADRILNEEGDKITFNNCPECGRLTRTPYAKQCRFCGNDWH
jgi:hypothetical protein